MYGSIIRPTEVARHSDVVDCCFIQFVAVTIPVPFKYF